MSTLPTPEGLLKWNEAVGRMTKQMEALSARSEVMLNIYVERCGASDNKRCDEIRQHMHVMMDCVLDEISATYALAKHLGVTQ